MNAIIYPKAKNIKELLHSSFQMLGEKEIKYLLFARLKFIFFYYLILLLSAYYVSYNFRAGLNWIIFIALIFFLYLYGFLFHVKKRAQLIWIVYNKITRIHTTLEESEEIVRQQKWPLRLFALLEIKLSLSSQEREEKTGVIDRLMASAMLSLGGLYKIAEDFLLPAIIIERLPLTEAAAKLRQLTQNLPATLTGVFGIDFFSGILSSVINFIFGAIIIGIVFSFWLLPHFLNGQPLSISSISTSSENTRLLYFSLFVGIIVISAIRELLNAFITTLKAIYFAIFYTSINKSHEIAPDMREKTITYLNSINKDWKI